VRFVLPAFRIFSLSRTYIRSGPKDGPGGEDKAVVSMKRAASVLLMVMMLVMALSAKSGAVERDWPREVAGLDGGLPQYGTVLDDELTALAAAGCGAAAETDSMDRGDDSAGVSVPGGQTAELTSAVESEDTASAHIENISVQELKDRAIVLPEIGVDAPAPAQIKSLPESGMVCLTFDDGYSKASIETILGCLREQGVHCTFFVIGACLKLYPELWRQAVEDGHEIAYHTMNHRPLTRSTNTKIVEDLSEWCLTATGVLGIGYRAPKIARAPGGTTNMRVRQLFAALGYELIYWSCDTFTGVYRSNHGNAGARAAAYVLRHAAVGAISLQHFNAYDAASVSRYIAEMSARFRLGTVSEALAMVKTFEQKKALADRIGLHGARPFVCDIG